MFGKRKFFNFKTYQQQTNLKKRVPSSIIFCFLCVILLILSWLSDPLSMSTTSASSSWLTFLNPTTARQIVPYMSALFLIFCSLIPFQIVYELTRGCFMHIWTRSRYLVLVILVLFGSTVCNFIYLPLIYWGVQVQTQTNEIKFISPMLFLTASLVMNFVVFIVSKIIINSDYANSKFNKRMFPIAMLLISSFILFLEYIGINHTWSSLFLLLAIPVLSDLFAYLGGSIFGKHKISPTISPKKSWEGFFIGVILAFTATMAFVYALSLYHPHNQTIFSPVNLFFGFSLGNKSAITPTHLYWWLCLGLLILILCLVSVGGDLFFSLVKRRNFIKDYSQFFSGHGGILDRIDSTVCVVWVYGLFTVVSSIITGLIEPNNILVPCLMK